MSDKQQVRALIQSQRWMEAKELCHRVCQRHGNDAEAWILLGAINSQVGTAHEVEACCRRVIALSPDAPVAYCNLGIALLHQGKNDEAISSFQHALKIRPDYLDAHVQLGALYASLKKLNEAVSHYRRAIAIKPDNTFVLNNLAGALLERVASQDDFEEAEKCYRQALRYRSDMPAIHMNLATLLRDTGRHDEAMACYRRVLELLPGDEDALAGMAGILEYKTEYAAGYALLRPLLEKGTDNGNVALAYGALARHLDRGGEAIALLERVVRQNKPVRMLRNMHFRLGKLYDEMKEYDKAFEHCHEAHALGEAYFDATRNQREFDALIDVFSTENVARRPRASNRSRLPVFIVGMPRSGTSLVEQIIASHPEAYGAGELGDIHRISTTLPALADNGLPYPQCVDALTEKQLDEIAQRHLAKLGSYSREAARVTDKMPHNFLLLGLIDMLFPEARVIHCMRDPIDTCLSIYFLPSTATHPYTDDLTNLGAYFRQYQRLMAHWKAALRIPVLDIQYEDLVANQEEISRGMIEFCGLTWNERCLRFHETERVVATPSYDQVRRPLYKKSVARWKNYERHLGPLIAALGNVET